MYFPSIFHCLIWLIIVSFHHREFQKSSSSRFFANWGKPRFGANNVFKIFTNVTVVYLSAVSSHKILEKSFKQIRESSKQAFWARTGVKCPIMGAMRIFSKLDPNHFLSKHNDKTTYIISRKSLLHIPKKVYCRLIYQWQ